MPVVYDGVNGKQGNLFLGIKLWISQRVPQRSRYVDLVKGNGGEVVSLEKNADMLIADNIKRAGLSPPDGSYCWKWIDTSVKNGFLEEKSDYLIKTEARLVGASQPAKSHRNAFSKTEDLILLKWVSTNDMEVGGMTVRELFDELARTVSLTAHISYAYFAVAVAADNSKYPQHTSQSWYNRWTKHLRDRPRPSEVTDELEQVREITSPNRPLTRQAAIAHVPAHTTGSARHVQPTNEAGPRQAPPSSSPLRRAPEPSTPTPRKRPAPRGRNAFTAEEDQMLLAYVQDMKKLLKPTSGNTIYKDFASHHATHTWQAWRERYVKILRFREAADFDGTDEQSNAVQDKLEGGDEPQTSPRINVHASKPASSSVASNPIASHRGVETPGTAKASSSGTRPAAPRQVNTKSDEERLERREQEKREKRAAKLLQRTWRGHAVRRDYANLEAAFIPLQAIMRGYLFRLRKANRSTEALEVVSASDEADHVSHAENPVHAEEGSQGPEIGPDGMSQHDREARARFYDDLETYITVSGAKVIGGPLINGRSIDLWDLFSLATQQDCDPEERDWEQVARELGFDPATFPNLVGEVRECYLENLAEFEETIRAYDNDDGSEEGSDEDLHVEEPTCDGTVADLVPTSDAVTAPKQPLADPSSPAYRSSPPFAASKRTHQYSELLASDLGYPTDGSRKRRRLSKDVVIPLTPEEKLEQARSRLRRGAAHGDSSPLKSRSAVKGKTVEISSGEESDDAFDAAMEDVESADELPKRVVPHKRKYVEPKTQDWRFGMDNEHRLRHSIEECDVSPSQQLQLEFDAYDSPKRAFARSHVNARESANRPSSATMNAWAAGETGTRAVRSGPNSVAVEAPNACVFRAPLSGKPTKRALPPQYQQKPDLAAPAHVPVFNPTRNAITQPRPQPRLSNAVRPAGTFPVQPTNSRTPLVQPSSIHTPRSDILQSKRAPTFPSTSAPQPLNGNRATTKKTPKMTSGRAYVDAQIEHFQGLGYQEKHISRALAAASCQRGAMAVAVQSLAEGRGIPPNEAGIWTTNDDDDLRMYMEYERRKEKGKDTANAAREKRMELKACAAQSRLKWKHGDAGFDQRVDFMKMMESGDDWHQT